MTQRDAYRQEILAWLLGRLAKGPTTGRVPLQPPAQLPETPIRAWWIFEGKRYRGLDGPLSANFGAIDRQARRLLSSFSPVRRVVESPEGETDWIASTFHTLTSGRRTYVSRASGVGLNGDEKDALLGWLEWLRAGWLDYASSVGTPEGIPAEVPWQPRQLPISYQEIPNLRRWAHTAKRSRWPLLRNVAAESLRAVLEPQSLDRLPLPSQPDVLFEILCLVRILRVFEPNPTHIRWLDLATGQNEVHLPGLKYSFQHSLARAEVLSTSEFGTDLRDAMDFYGLGVPTRADGLLRFSEPRAGFQAILVEVKSGSQSPDAAIYQLKCYRAALRKAFPQPIVVWGIVEQEWRESATSGGSYATSLPPAHPNGDRWICSTADDIGETIAALGLKHAVTSDVSPLAAAS